MLAPLSTLLQEKGNALSKRIGSLKKCLEEQEPDKLVAMWDDYISEWHKVMMLCCIYIDSTVDINFIDPLYPCSISLYRVIADAL